MPTAALLDPALTLTMPARTTAATGFDALTHCLEAYVSLGDHPMADAIALGGLRLVAEHLTRAVAHPSDLEARGAMMKAAMMGAVAFQKGLGVCHSLAHPLSSEKNLHHGLANALCLPAVVDFNNQAVPDRIERVRFRCAFKVFRPDDDMLIAECQQTLALIELPAAKLLRLPQSWDQYRAAVTAGN